MNLSKPPERDATTDGVSGDSFERLEIVEIYSAGGIAPYQAEGRFSDGRDFYFRIRHSGAHLDAVGGHSVCIELTHPQGDPHVWSAIDPVDAAALLTFLVHTLSSIEEYDARQGAVEWDEGPNTADWLAGARP